MFLGYHFPWRTHINFYGTIAASSHESLRCIERGERGEVGGGASMEERHREPLEGGGTLGQQACLPPIPSLTASVHRHFGMTRHTTHPNRQREAVRRDIGRQGTAILLFSGNTGLCSALEGIMDWERERYEGGRRGGERTIRETRDSRC